MTDTKPDTALLDACTSVLQDVTATGSFRITATTCAQVRAAVAEKRERAAPPPGYARSVTLPDGSRRATAEEVARRNGN